MAVNPATISLAFTGFAVLQEIFDNVIQSAERETRRGQWYVVSIVRYGPFLEWQNPHWQVAIQSVADEIELDTSQQMEMLNAMVAGGNLTKKIADKLMRRVRRMIIEKDLIDTGNYLASIAMGDTLESAMSASMSQLLDESTSVVIDIS